MARILIFKGVLIIFFCYLQIGIQEKIDNELSKLSSENVRKSTTIFDYHTRMSAYKDLVGSGCYIEFIKTGEPTLSERLREFPSKKLPKELYLSDEKLSKRKIWDLAGPRIWEFCKGFPTYLIQEVKNQDSLRDTDDNNDIVKSNLRRKRSNNRHYFVGRLRGQTQSQYLNFGNNNGNDTGKAEAESNYGVSKATVVGSNGMGQAQSQSSSNNCDECYITGAQPPIYQRKPSDRTKTSWRNPSRTPQPSDNSGRKYETKPSSGEERFPGTGQIYPSPTGVYPGIPTEPTFPDRNEYHKRPTGYPLPLPTYPGTFIEPQNQGKIFPSRPSGNGYPRPAHEKPDSRFPGKSIHPGYPTESHIPPGQNGSGYPKRPVNGIYPHPPTGFGKTVPGKTHPGIFHPGKPTESQTHPSSRYPGEEKYPKYPTYPHPPSGYPSKNYHDLNGKHPILPGSPQGQFGGNFGGDYSTNIGHEGKFSGQFSGVFDVNGRKIHPGNIPGATYQPSFESRDRGEDDYSKPGVIPGQIEYPEQGYFEPGQGSPQPGNEYDSKPSRNKPGIRVTEKPEPGLIPTKNQPGGGYFGGEQPGGRYPEGKQPRLPGYYPEGPIDKLKPGTSSVETDNIEEGDEDDSQAQTSVQQFNNKTQANAQAQGKFLGGTAQSQVSGTYSGSGSFSASAGSDDGNRGASTQVFGNKQGSMSSAQGHGGNGNSQAQTQLFSDTGKIISSSQSGGKYKTQTQVQGGEEGGLANAQSNGIGQTSSQAQIGFSPYKKNENSNNGNENYFLGGGMANAQGNSKFGQSQTQIQGKFQYGVKYTGSAQAQSGASRNFTKLETFKTPSLTHESLIEEKRFSEENDGDYDYEESETNRVISQTRDGQTQQILLPNIGNYDAQIIQANSDNNERILKDGELFESGQMVPGASGYRIPSGFRGKIKSIASPSETKTFGRNSQAQTVTLLPSGTGKIIYRRNALNQFKSGTETNLPFLPFSDNENLPTQCKFLRNSCIFRKTQKICLPKIVRNTDGTLMVC